jgi:hypothetical protein
LKLTSLLRPGRSPLIVVVALMLAATTSDADAFMYCDRASDYPAVSDPVATRRIEARLQSIPAMKNHQIRSVGSQFAIAWQDEDECRKAFRCNHLLLDLRNDDARVVFTLVGTGTIWRLGSPVDQRSNPLNDNYALKAFETDEFNYIQVGLPSHSGPVWIGAALGSNMTLKACEEIKYK